MPQIGWDALEEGAKVALDEALASWRARGLPCGASIVDGRSVIARGRNHAYDAPSGSDALEGTPLAHAEMNALAQVSTDRDLSSATLWSTQQPCTMCAAAVTFCGIGATRFLAADLSSPASDHLGAGDAIDPTVEHPELTVWAILANAMFLQPAFFAGRVATYERSRDREPEMVEAAELLARSEAPGLVDLLAGIGDRLGELATQRLARLHRP